MLCCVVLSGVEFRCISALSLSVYLSFRCCLVCACLICCGCCLFAVVSLLCLCCFVTLSDVVVYCIV